MGMIFAAKKIVIVWGLFYTNISESLSPKVPIKCLCMTNTLLQSRVKFQSKYVTTEKDLISISSETNTNHPQSGVAMYCMIEDARVTLRGTLLRGRGFEDLFTPTPYIQLRSEVMESSWTWMSSIFSDFFFPGADDCKLNYIFRSNI